MHVNIYIIVSSNKVTQFRMLIVLVGNLLMKIFLFYSILCYQVYGKRIFKREEENKNFLKPYTTQLTLLSAWATLFLPSQNQ